MRKREKNVLRLRERCCAWMKIFKNYRTKKQLREENERLKAMLSVPTQIHTVERNVQKVQSSFVVPCSQRDIPEEVIKNQIARNMIEFLQPLIEYDFTDDKHGGKNYYGNLYAASKK